LLMIISFLNYLFNLNIINICSLNTQKGDFGFFIFYEHKHPSCGRVKNNPPCTLLNLKASEPSSNISVKFFELFLHSAPFKVIPPTPDYRVDGLNYLFKVPRLLSSGSMFDLFLELLECFLPRSPPTSVKVKNKEFHPFLTSMDDPGLLRTQRQRQRQLQLSFQNLTCPIECILCFPFVLAEYQNIRISSAYRRDRYPNSPILLSK